MDIMNLFFLNYFSGFLMYVFWRKHFLVMLLSLEYINLSIYLGFYYYLSYNYINLFFIMLYLTMVVCEGVLGLSIMVMIMRLIGNESVMNLNSLW